VKSQDQRPVDCAAFKRSLFHFQADEIPETNRTPLEEHLADCQCCAGRLAFEDGMLSGVRKRLGAGEPPPGLETRVRASLRQASPAGATRGWFRAPLSVAAIAASLLLAVLLVPLGDATGLPTQASGEPYAGTVRVVDLDCHRA
jgi:anti-sigma factor RsiW